MKIFIVIIIFSIISVICSNIAARYLKNFYGKKIKYITDNKLLFLLIIPTKNKISLRGFVNYIIQFVLLFLYVALFLIGLFSEIIFSMDIYLLLLYFIISFTSIAFSGIMNRHGWLEPN